MRMFIADNKDNHINNSISTFVTDNNDDDDKLCQSKWTTV